MDTSFCSRCGFLLTGTADLLMTGGLIPHIQAPTGFKAASPRNRGLKQGLFIFLLTFLIVPLIAIISVASHAPPFGVAIAAILLTTGGLLRMAYALMFESQITGGHTLDESAFAGAQTLLRRSRHMPGLPPQQTYPVPSYVQPATGNWRDTNELEPGSVTEGTTKLLESDEIPQ